ncbi:hypothetical protein DMA11_02505 [Marinilabiliaceae bacterium JC017]|nr:hypothetical protein DMA11_02505 [Marinilabiliaceae bacterium JC017]
MKKLLFSLFFLFSMFSLTGYAQGGEDLLKLALKDMGDGQYMKDFTIELKKAKKDVKTGYVKFSVILNSRSHYKFNVVNGSSNAEQAIMQLYDGDKLLVSNFESGKHYKSCEFICGKTKVYNLIFSFKGGEEGTARAVLSLVKQYSEAEMKF